MAAGFTLPVPGCKTIEARPDAVFDALAGGLATFSGAGIGVKAAEWLATKDPMLVGSDNWPVEVAPNPDPQISLPVHQIMLVVNGIHLLENLKLDELAAKKVYEFAFMMQPLKAQGFSGSTVAPVAIR